MSKRRRTGPLVAPSLALALLLSACGGGPPELSVGDSTQGPAKVIRFDPPQGATGVDPGLASLSVTFDREMDPEGWAWVVENESTAPELGDSTWDPTHRVNTAPARLEPGRLYVVWINTPQYPYFKDLAGVPASPVRWTFSTSGTAGAGGTPKAIPAHGAAGAPSVVQLDPPEGAVDVDPDLGVLKVIFDRPMAEGWSWVTEGVETFPKPLGRASQSEDMREAYLPVQLEPGRAYVVWLNSDRHRDFKDAAGNALAPVRWTFRTRPAT